MRVLCKAVGLCLCACVLSLAAVAPTVGQQSPIELKPSFTLKTGKHVGKLDARRVALSGSIGHVQPDRSEPAQVIGGSMWLPRGLELHGGKFPTCSGKLMRRYRSVDRCARGSILGMPDYGFAFDHAKASVVDGFGDAGFVIVNGGRRRIWAFMTIYNPALVQEPVAIDVHELRGRRWSHRLDFRIPQVLIIVAGVPVALRSFDIELDGIGRAPGYLTLNRRCPKGGHFAYRTSLAFLHNDGTTSEASRRGRLTCRGSRA